LHQLIQVDNDLLDLQVGLVVIVGLIVAIAALAVAVVPCVHHLSVSCTLGTARR
jgi:hypothetical protein